LENAKSEGNKMHDLSIIELNLVSGAGGLADTANAAQVGGALGGAAGISYGMSIGATGNAVLGLGAAGAGAGAGLAVAGVGGYSIGQWLNNNTPIQSWIANMLPDPSGIDYNTFAGTDYNQ